MVEVLATSGEPREDDERLVEELQRAAEFLHRHGAATGRSRCARRSED